jgi:hypothetical protein
MYCQFRILTFIAYLLWVTRLWTVGVMLDNDILPPLAHLVGLVKAGTRKQMKSSDVRKN